VLSKDAAKKPTALRKIDPFVRVKGWRYLSSHVDQVRRQVREEGQREPVLAGLRWDVPGLLGIYGDGHPPVYSLGLAFTDRHSQYDWWRPNPVADAQEFRGRTFVCVGGVGIGDPLRAGFDSVDHPVMVEYRESGLVVAQWHIVVCRGYKGFPESSGRPGGARH